MTYIDDEDEFIPLARLPIAKRVYALPPDKEARALIDTALAEAGREQYRGGHTYRRPRVVAPPMQTVRDGRGRIFKAGKTIHGMFLLARFEHLCSIGRTDLI